MALAFQRESLFPSVFFEIQPLLERHWAGVGMKEACGPVDVDETAYRALADARMLYVTTAREGGRLVGYAVYFIVPNFYYKSRRVTESDVFFLLPEYRKGLAGFRLLKEANRALSGMVDVIVNKVKVEHDCGRLFDRMGGRLSEKHYMKAVG